ASAQIRVVNMEQTQRSTDRHPLRLWPGVTAAALLIFFRFILPLISSGGEILGVDTVLISTLSSVLFAALIIVWWIFFSRAPWSERLLGLVAIIVMIIALRPLAHISIQNGFMNLMFYMSAPVTQALALVVWALATRGVTGAARRISLIAAIFAGTAIWTLWRTDGLFNGRSVMQWRWSPTAEERLLAQAEDVPKPLPPAPALPNASQALVPGAAGGVTVAAPPATVSPTATADAALGSTATAPAVMEPGVKRAGSAMSEPGVARVEWPGFRGPNRDGVAPGVHINTNWGASPPVQLWRRPVGPGWSSFAVSGDLLYTQEQRGDDEVVACYRVSTGEPVWRHRDAARFYESNGGAGPRGTPTIHNGRAYALGATGILNALDARTGSVVWSRNAAKDTGRGLPGWGFTSSPLIIDDVIIVATSGTMVGYEIASGKPRWTGPRLLGSYSSPHRVTIDGVTQAILLSGSGAASVDPSTGAVLWQNEWTDGGTTIVQPVVIGGGDMLITTASAMGGVGVRRLHVARESSGEWKVEERWTSNGLKPYFNDFVVHKGHAIGFDGNILASINLGDGKRDWKGGRYGNGQLLLLPDQDLLLVISEEGELALVSALPDRFAEVAKFPVLDGKTWNHPVIIGDILLVRNGEEMAAFRLTLADR
ncbi:MAG: PQQ-binding-like beta-propeller repeat protein, partial [Vicinamibacterales bacterium]